MWPCICIRESKEELEGENIEERLGCNRSGRSKPAVFRGVQRYKRCTWSILHTWLSGGPHMSGSSTTSRFTLPRQTRACHIWCAVECFEQPEADRLPRCAASSCTCCGSLISSRGWCASGHVATKGVRVNVMPDSLMYGIVWSKKPSTISMTWTTWTSVLVAPGGVIRPGRWRRSGSTAKASESELAHH